MGLTGLLLMGTGGLLSGTVSFSLAAKNKLIGIPRLISLPVFRSLFASPLIAIKPPWSSSTAPPLLPGRV